MSQGRKEIEKLEGCLTPNQAVLVWLEEVDHCRDLAEFVAYLRGQPETARPLRRLPDQMREAIEQAMKGQPKETINAEVRRATRDVAFLIYLHRHANIRIVEPMRAWGLQLSLLKERLYRVAMDRDRAEQQARRNKHRPHRNGNLRLEQDWADGARLFLTELYAARDAVKAISTLYFGGHELLFPDLAIVLDYIVGETETLAELFHQSVDSATDRKRRIDLQAILCGSRKEADRRTSMIVCMAKSDALTFMGDDEGALRLADRLVEMDARGDVPSSTI